MIVKLPNNKLRVLSVNEKELLSSWSNVFSKEFLNSYYMQNLLSFLHIKYSSKSYLLRPVEKNKIFAPFKMCNYADLKVVLIGEYPSVVPRSNNVLNGCSWYVNETAITPELSQIKRCIENTIYDGLQIHFDNSLHNWGEQGVLPINMCLTGTAKNQAAHTKYWKPFMIELIEQISSKNAGIIFAFIGRACDLSNYIKDKHYHKIVTEPTSLAACVNSNGIWMSDIFRKIDTELLKLHGNNNYRIEW